MADEELRDLELTHGYGGGSGGRWAGGAGGAGGTTWGRSPGAGGSLSASHQRMAPSQHHSNRAAEAEDIMGRAQVPRGRSGLYYSPPGTSYTIVERPPGVGGGGGGGGGGGVAGGGGGGGGGGSKPRGTYLGSSTSFSHNNRTPASGKKRPISPEQVLQMLGHNHLKAPSAQEPHQTRRPAPPPPTMDQLAVRTVNMSRGPADGTQSHGFGICVKGGTKDSGVGVYISRVEEGSVAERAGLRPGDSILEVNGTPFTGISHEEALKMLKSCRQLSMTVRSPHPPPPPAPGGSNPWLVRQTYSWIDRQGRPVSPPLEYARASPPVLVAPPPPPPRWNYSRNIKDRPIRKVELSIEPGQSLGLMIRGGVEYNLGIFITGVDKDSVADRAGLMIGDQILEVNGQSFLDVTHDEAVNQLKFHKRMTLTVRDVGKVPHSCTAYDNDPWDSPQARRIHASRSAALQMVDEKARVVLKKSEFNTLTYYLDEYSARQMTIEAFVAVLLELLNTPEKYTLLTELREVVMPEDRGRFDELVYRRESEGQRLQHIMDTRHPGQHARRKGGAGGCCDPNQLLTSMHHEPPEYHASAARPCRVPLGSETIYSEPEDFRTPSEDSGLGLGPSELGPGRGMYPRETICRERDCRWSPSSLNKRTSDLALSNDEDYDHGHQDYGESHDGEMHNSRRHHTTLSTVSALNQPYDDANMCGYLEGLRSQLGGWTQKVKSWYWGNPLQLAHKLGRGFDLKEDQELLESEPGGLSSMRHSNMRLSRGDLQDSSADNEAQVVPDSQGNLRITVKKTKPLLGIAIEGGANTRHPLPRIINIHENGAAFDAGGLEVGQLILEVDGQKVEGMQHQEVARLIAESFARRERQEIEFLVVEAKKSNLEPKPTALIFLEA